MAIGNTKRRNDATQRYDAQRCAAVTFQGERFNRFARWEISEGM
jgi:hypothetical protein